MTPDHGGRRCLRSSAIDPALKDRFGLVPERSPASISIRCDATVSVAWHRADRSGSVAPGDRCAPGQEGDA